MKLLIIRHGETIENRDGIVQGQNPGNLTLKGKKQAQKLSRRLKNEVIDIVYSSDLKRAKDTTKEILKYHRVPVIYTEILRERCLGCFEGKLREEYCQAEKNQGKFSFIPENGEDFKDFEKRVRFFFDYIYLNFPDKTILICSHTRFIKILLGIILSKKLNEAISIHQSNACLNIIEIKKTTCIIQVLNSTDHLNYEKLTNSRD